MVSLIEALIFHSGNTMTLVARQIPGTLEIPVGAHGSAEAGYDDPKKVFIFRNSCGVVDSHGSPVQDHGYLYLPYEYLLDDDLSADFRTLRAIYVLR